MTRLLRFRAFSNVPLFLPGVVLSIVVGFVARQRAARWLTVSPGVAWATIVALGVILSATLTPLRESPFSQPPLVPGCDFSRMGLAPVREILRFNDTILNIALFVPLGVCLAQVRNRRRRLGLIGLAAGLPILIEATQLVVTPLDRACQSADVFDNVTGLVIGVGLGLAGAAVWSARMRTPVEP